jgi:hypothetical protein
MKEVQEDFLLGKYAISLARIKYKENREIER